MTEPVPTRPIELEPDRFATKRAMAVLLSDWARTDSGVTDVGLAYRTASCGCASPMGYWQLEADLLDQYGPLPFTSRGRTIRWRWWHRWTGRARWRITGADLPPDRS